MKSKKSSAEIALAKAALNREYSFEWGVDFDKRILRVTGEIGDGMFAWLDSALTEMEATSARKIITVRIHSPGGHTYEATAMLGRMRRSPCPIVTEGYGHMMSAATILLAGGTHKRLMSELAFFMHHEASYEIVGKHSELKAEVAQGEEEEIRWCKTMENLTSMPYEFWKSEGTAVNAYFSAEECLSMGVIDETF